VTFDLWTLSANLIPIGNFVRGRIGTFFGLSISQGVWIYCALDGRLSSLRPLQTKQVN
jgi:hypothetical protein